MNFYSVNHSHLDRNCLLARLLRAGFQRRALMKFLIEYLDCDHHQQIIGAT